MAEDVEYTFLGNPDCAICGALAGTTGPYPIPPPHDNCACENEATCENTFDFSGGSTRYGPDGSCFVFTAEISVFCWDGSEIGQSIPIDMGCEGGEDELAEVWDAVADIAADMARDCPDCKPPLVS